MSEYNETLTTEDATSGASASEQAATADAAANSHAGGVDSHGAGDQSLNDAQNSGEHEARIPKSRLDEVIAQREAERQRADQIAAELQQVRQTYDPYKPIVENFQNQGLKSANDVFTAQQNDYLAKLQRDLVYERDVLQTKSVEQANAEWQAAIATAQLTAERSEKATLKQQNNEMETRFKEYEINRTIDDVKEKFTALDPDDLEDLREFAKSGKTDIVQRAKKINERNVARDQRLRAQYATEKAADAALGTPERGGGTNTAKSAPLIDPNLSPSDYRKEMQRLANETSRKREAIYE